MKKRINPEPNGGKTEKRPVGNDKRGIEKSSDQGNGKELKN